MEEYYFLFALAIVWMIFAVVQDLKTREVANWLNFSLIGFALAYRAFYSSFTGEWMFLGFGFLGFLMFNSMTAANRLRWRMAATATMTIKARIRKSMSA